MSKFDKTLTIGIIGLGRQGKKHLDSAIALESKKELKLVGVCDVDKNAYDNHKVNLFLDYRDLYSATHPDVVLIATPNYLHKKMTLDALNRGIHVIKEKPLAVDYFDALEMAKASRNAKKLILTTQQRFFLPLFLKAKNIIPSLGRIVSFSYRFTLNDTAKSWRWDFEKAGGGSWLNMGWHAVSIIQWLIGDIDSIELTWRVNGKREWDYYTDHSSFARVTIGNNVVGSIFLSCAYPKKEEALKIVFSDGILYLSRDILKVIKKGKKQKGYYSTLDEHSIYTAQVKELLKKIRNNNYSQIQDLRIMAVIQAGIQSVHSNSSLVDIEKIYNKKSNAFHSENITYATL